MPSGTRLRHSSNRLPPGALAIEYGRVIFLSLKAFVNETNWPGMKYSSLTSGASKTKLRTSGASSRDSIRVAFMDSKRSLRVAARSFGCRRGPVEKRLKQSGVAVQGSGNFDLQFRMPGCSAPQQQRQIALQMGTERQEIRNHNHAGSTAARP